MLASTLRNVSRGFATVVETTGFKVAAIDRGQPTVAVTFLFKAGSRYETRPGVSQALKTFAFKSTASRSTLGTVRESELYGGVLSSCLSREHLAITAEFLRGDEEFFVDVLASFMASARFTPHELQEYVIPVIESEAAAARADPATQALEAAHALAFRSGLGGFLAWPSSTSPAIDEIKEYARSAFAKGNFAVVGTGINDTMLTKLVENSLRSYASSNAAPPVSTPSTYHGGETRIELSTHGKSQTLFIGYGATGKPSPDLAALAAHLSQPSVKWSRGLSPISAGIPVGTSVQTILLPYSDATLFGLLVRGPNSNVVKEAAKVAVRELKNAETSLSKMDALKKATAKAKFAAATALDSREGFQSVLGAKVLEGGQATLESTLSALDKVTSATLSKSASALLKGKPTYIAVGDVSSLPYADEVGC